MTSHTGWWFRMARDMDKLKLAAQAIIRRADDEHKGLGLVLLAFDSRGPADRPVAMHLHGIDEADALRLLGSLAAKLEQVVEDGVELGPRILAGPQLVKPS